MKSSLGGCQEIALPQDPTEGGKGGGREQHAQVYPPHQLSEMWHAFFLKGKKWT